jgi:hypothetical protein
MPLFNFIKSIIILVISGPVLWCSNFDEASTFIREWVKTKQLIGEESTEWNKEKAALSDIRDALKKEIEELDKRLQETEEEAVGAARQRATLLEEKEEIEETTLSLMKGVEKLQKQMEEACKLLPTPLNERLSPFQQKLGKKNLQANFNLRQRVDTILSMLQAIAIYHRNVNLERQEFALEDGISREFQVLYFGLGVAYFVNESGTVSGYGIPSENGWLWRRQDSLAREISTGVDMVNNRTMPRFLKLPFPKPEGGKK